MFFFYIASESIIWVKRILLFWPFLFFFIFLFEGSRIDPSLNIVAFATRNSSIQLFVFLVIVICYSYYSLFVVFREYKEQFDRTTTPQPRFLNCNICNISNLPESFNTALQSVHISYTIRQISCDSNLKLSRFYAISHIFYAYQSNT